MRRSDDRTDFTASWPRRVAGGRRRDSGRRMILDRRHEDLAVEVERRTGDERRSGEDRRRRDERRHSRDRRPPDS